MKGPDISVVVCAHDRTAPLRAAIESLLDQELDPSRYEILVVDNGGLAEVAKVIAKLAETGRVRALVEARPELSHARNRGWREARGRFVAFLDDDAVASRSWLSGILRAFETARPEPGAVGGKVLPLWERERPPWLPDELLPALSIVDWAAEPVALARWQYLVGTNMAFPRDVLEALGGFDPALGRAPGGLLSNEELQLEHRLRARGLALHYDPQVVVCHRIPPERVTPEFLERRYLWQGISDGLMTFHLAGVSLAVRASLAARGLARSLWRLRRAPWLVVPPGTPERLAARCEAWRGVGFFRGLWRGLRRRATP